MHRPIGVYDSGMGGLIVLETLIEKFPHEDFLFIADGAHFPYGIKTKEEIETYNVELANYLVKQNVKAICIACNTATSHSSTLDSTIQVPLIKAVAPNVKGVAKYQDLNKNNILILATMLTTKSKIYEKELDKWFKDVPHQYYSVPTQEFVGLVEEGNVGTKTSLEKVRDILTPYLDKDIDKIVLGCTHFPKLIPEIKTLFPKALIFDSGQGMAEELKNKLNAFETAKLGTITLYTTGDIETFKKHIGWFKYLQRSTIKHLEIN